jgi:hypothetical protein
MLRMQGGEEMNFFVIGLIIGFLFSFTATYYYQTYYMGDYKIDQMYLSSTNPQGKEYCDNCLWIVFYEGCNRYKTYYFENQHEFDERLSVGQPVNIKFNNGHVRYVQPTKKYRIKC